MWETGKLRMCMVHFFLFFVCYFPVCHFSVSLVSWFQLHRGSDRAILPH